SDPLGDRLAVMEQRLTPEHTVEKVAIDVTQQMFHALRRRCRCAIVKGSAFEEERKQRARRDLVLRLHLTNGESGVGTKPLDAAGDEEGLPAIGVPRPHEELPA